MRILIFISITFMLAASPLLAAGGHTASHKPTMTLELTPAEDPIANKEDVVETKLTHITDGLMVTDEQLKTVHTQKIHLLVIDPTFTDYQHIHPTHSAIPGAYEFTFTPKFSGGYKVWADVTTVNGTQEYVMAQLGDLTTAKFPKTVSYNTTIDGYHFELEFDEKPKRDAMSMGTIHITNSAGKEVKNLRPVMGAFAHIVGFYEDFEHIVHIHPLGKEPSNSSMRGGPDLEFHLEPSQAGFIKLFAQVNIDGKEIFAPFTINVLP